MSLRSILGPGPISVIGGLMALVGSLAGRNEFAALLMLFGIVLLLGGTLWAAVIDGRARIKGKVIH